MATKRIKKQAPAQNAPAEQARALWLAGLGAVSIAQKRGGELFETLTHEGQDFQTRTEKFAKTLRADARKQVIGVIAPLKANTKQALAQAAAAARNALASALAKLGIPSKSDIEELTTRVTALSRQLKAR
jgi:poly(hydroxyalkanoate) granule-associated protein